MFYDSIHADVRPWIGRIQRECHFQVDVDRNFENKHGKSAWMPLAMHGALVDMLRWKNPRARSPHSKVGPTHVFMLPHTGSSWDYSRQQVGNSLRAGVTDEVLWLWKRSRVRGTSGRE